ncbi:3-deoxy-7-phosphoheptulonate synthase [Dictyobacter sp. S3.2.2.5]|uniref:3-deoxy-7-phosphoheptulonate synthase n=1 Tax=Dictyobacter halimunensis TaxID=3026934 RepID=A0ABQ6FII0_9CHLR|nr:3-deoxy-7-phosphoheptulonate synthase [Dictyobacter sp. S3.2.2.5]
MIILLRKQASMEEKTQLLSLLSCFLESHPALEIVRIGHYETIAIDAAALDHMQATIIRNHGVVEDVVTVDTPYKLVSRAFYKESSCVVVGKDHDCQEVAIGDSSELAPVVIAGPCSVESRDQLLASAQSVKNAGAQMLRGGAFKPRTSPYQFQGLGIEGLKLLAEARQLTGLPVVTEVMEPAMVDVVAEYADMLQIGSRNMYNYPLLRAVGSHPLKRPVMLKRGLSATIDEWLLAAEYIVAAGNPNVVLCERGIRSYDSHTRNVLDVASVPVLKELTHLPVLIDPSHGTGFSRLVPVMARAGIAAGASGLMIEVHHNAAQALTDKNQALSPMQLQSIVEDTYAIHEVLNGVKQSALQIA